MKIAVVGSGISGLTCLHVLSRQHEVHLFEADSRLGGHTHTVEVEVPSGRYAIDTGFIVFNDWTYPNFIRLLSQLGVSSKESSMSFSVKVEANQLEYNGTSLNSLFAQRSNLVRPGFYRMIREILRFNREAPLAIQSDATEVTLGSYLREQGFSREFKEHYLIPMGAAIWSASTEQMAEFPLRFFVKFFENHGMLSVDKRPTWRVVEGGSSSYIEPLIRPARERVHLHARVRGARRREGRVQLALEQRGERHEAVFDHVIFATHADQTLAILEDATEREWEILSSFSYQANETILHTDESVLPERKLARAAWNYWVPRERRNKVAVTYDMNVLQGIRAPEIFSVSLNLEDRIDPRKVLKRLTYHHPVFTDPAIAAQARWGEISGRRETHFCGAYWGYGFHEDGVKSALNVCRNLGAEL